MIMVITTGDGEDTYNYQNLQFQILDITFSSFSLSKLLSYELRIYVTRFIFYRKIYVTTFHFK